jgi:hypothetical protein
MSPTPHSLPDTPRPAARLSAPAFALHRSALYLLIAAGTINLMLG